MKDINFKILIFTLNVNRLNIPLKAEFVKIGLKKKTQTTKLHSSNTPLMKRQRIKKVK